MKLFWIGIFLLSFGQLSTFAQAPALEIFTSPDGRFRFVYPQNYQLVVGESILRATQGRHQSLPVCNFATALACVIYPVENTDETRFEAGGFSVDAISGVSDESECLAYSDLAKAVEGQALQLSSISIHDHIFRHASIRKKIPGHSQAAELYRTFLQQKCYELHVMVSLADGASLQRVVRTGSLGDPMADSARESLELILSSFTFNQ